MITQEQLSNLSYGVIGCAIEVHKEFGPGLLESVYEDCMEQELLKRGYLVNSQALLHLSYKGLSLKRNFKIDLIVNNLLILELKAIEVILPVHKAQLLSYLKLSGKPKGLLINFHSANLKDHIISMVTQEFAALPVK